MNINALPLRPDENLTIYKSLGPWARVPVKEGKAGSGVGLSFVIHDVEPCVRAGEVC